MWRWLLGTLLNSPDLAGGTVVSWGIGWAGGWSALGFTAALLAAVGAAALAYRGQGRIAPRRTLLALAALRAGAFTALILLLAQPVLRITKTGTIKGTCIVLVDRTRSMNIVDHLSHAEMVTALRALGRMPADAADDAPLSEAQRDTLKGLSRFALVKGALDHQSPVFLKDLAERFDVEVMTFGAHLLAVAGRRDGPESVPRPVLSGRAGFPAPADDLAARLAALAPPDGETTRLGAALRGALERLRGQPVAGLILISDGANNAGEDPRVVADYAGRLGVPIFPVAVGAAEARDLYLAHILGDDVVFKDDVTPLAVRIQSQGYAGRRVTLTLTAGEGDDQTVLAVRRDVVIAGDGEQTEEINFVPQAAGRTRLTVTIEPLPDEQNPHNNAATTVVRVTDKKIRVLYVERRPRWEFRFLRHAMVRDARVQPTLLLQEADPQTAGSSVPRPDLPGRVFASDPIGSAAPLFIRSFPEEREALFSYDVIIFGEVNLDYLTVPQLRMVVDFVETAGGGLALLASDDRGGGTVGPRALAATPLGAVLPVVFESGRAGRVDFDYELDHPLTEGYRPRRTPTGLSHPVVRFAPTPAESDRVWERLPEFYWFYANVAQVKPAAQVLLEHPTARNRLGSVPLLVVRPFGQGRSAFIGFDEAWRWRSLEATADDPDGVFYRFYGQLIQYLGLSHLLGESRRVQVTLDRREVGVGEPISIFARVLDESFRPAVAERITAVVRRVAGGEGASPAEREVGRLTLVPAEVLRTADQAEPREQRTPSPRPSPNGRGSEGEGAAPVGEPLRGAPGTYRGQFTPAEEGEYQVAIDDPALADDAGGEDGEASLAVFTAVAPRLEFARVTRDADLLRALALKSGGAQVPLDQLARLPRELEQKRRAEPVRLDLPLWDSWLALIVAAALPCVEWFVRKRARLA